MNLRYRTDGQCVFGPSILLDVVQGSVEYFPLDVFLVDGVFVVELLSFPGVLLGRSRIITRGRRRR